MSDFRNYMNNDYGCIDTFYKSCEDMASSKLILADSKISSILLSITSSSILYDIIEQCLQEFDYADSLANATRRDVHNRLTLIMPTDIHEFAALAFMILYEFDMGKNEIHNFTTEYFSRLESASERYVAFCTAIILPFKKCIAKLLNNQTNNKDIVEADKFFEGDMISFSSDVIEELLGIIRNILIEVSSDNSLNFAEKEEFATVFDGLSNAIITKNEKLIKTMYVGCKSCVKNSHITKKLVPFMVELVSVLQKVEIIVR